MQGRAHDGMRWRLHRTTRIAWRDKVKTIRCTLTDCYTSLRGWQRPTKRFGLARRRQMQGKQTRSRQGTQARMTGVQLAMTFSYS